MNVLVIQNKVLFSVKETLQEIDILLEDIDFSVVDFIVFGEMFTTPYEVKYFDEYSTYSNEVLNYLSALAKKTNSYVIGGSIPYKDNGLFNRTVVFDRDGNKITHYDKIHLFEVMYPDGTHFSEGDVLDRGDKIVSFDTEFGKIGLLICFDIRFPEQAYLLSDCNVIFVPAAFNTYTGPMHWKTTFKARAIDNQLFMIGCSPSRMSVSNYDVYGHSIVVNPFGKVINELDEKTSTMLVSLELDEIEHARNSIPILKNRVKIKTDD